MSETEQIKAIAELDGPKLVGLRKRGLWYRSKACGYTSCECEAGRFTLEEAKAREYVHGELDDVKISEFSPKPYLTDLNAIHEVEMLCLRSISADERYRRELIGVLMEKHAVESDICACAAHRAEALLRATGKWK